ncbi:MAG TPA: ABC transporter transmembrane domain-containing protein [Chloroflexota bacterium]|nr:ABC transporter transmembrane domain-containing protein [Chloroflexota bacterium]
MSNDEPVVRTDGPLIFHARIGSYAEERLDGLTAAFSSAASRIAEFFGKRLSDLAPINLCFVDVPHTHAEGGAAPEEVYCLQISSESPGQPAEIVLTPIVADQLLGPGHPFGRFWIDGLAGYLAAQAGETEYVEMPAHVNRMREEGQLQSVLEYIRQRAERRSPVASKVAAAFVMYLISWRGVDRFQRLLQEARKGNSNAFRAAYRPPLQVAEGQWLRKLEAANQTGGGSMLDAVKELRPYFTPYRGALSWVMLTIILGLSFDLFVPFAFRFLLDQILSRRPLPFAIPGIGNGGEQIAVDERMPTLLILLGAMVFMFIVNTVARIRQTYLVATVSQGVNLELRRRFFGHMQVLPVTFHARTAATDISQRFFTDIAYVPAALSTGLVPLISNGLAMLLFGFSMLSTNLLLAGIAIAGLPLFAFSARTGRVTTRELQREGSRRVSEIQQALFENLAGQRFLRFWNARQPTVNRFEEKLQINRDLNIRTTLVTSTFARATMLITNAAQVAILITGGAIVILSNGQDLTAGALAAFYLLLLRLYGPAGQFAGATQSLTQGGDGLNRLRRIFEQKPEEEPAEPLPLGPLKRRIELRDVAITQSGGKVVLRGLSAEIPAGKKIAFVGPTGSGKANLITLFPRLESATSGQVLWDETDTSTVSRESLRAQLMVLTQDTFVLNATIYENIRITKPVATEEEVLRASSDAGLHDFVNGLPGGYDTITSDRDPTLSAPIRQRLNLARALLRDLSVVLMDDALSALDPPTQREMELKLRAHASSGTLIVVAQRLGSIDDADNIYVMDDGRVVEAGTHDELLDKQGLYVQLLKDELGEAAVSGARQAMRRLSKLAPFSSLPPEVIEETSNLLLFMERGPGQDIVREGSLGDELFIIGRGEVEIVVHDDEGNEQIVATLSEGDYFGEISFLRRTARTATVRARTPTELHVLRRVDFDLLMNRLGEGTLEHMEETARARLEDTRSKLAALSA